MFNLSGPGHMLYIITALKMRFNDIETRVERSCAPRKALWLCVGNWPPDRHTTHPLAIQCDVNLHARTTPRLSRNSRGFEQDVRWPYCYRQISRFHVRLIIPPPPSTLFTLYYSIFILLRVSMDACFLF